MNHEDYLDIGKILTAARQETGLSVEQVSKELHIRKRYVIALEEGKLQDLPGLAYTKGYLQAYAVFLDLDKHEVLRQFENIEAALARKGFYLPAPLAREKSPAPAFIWAGIALVLLAYMLWALLQPSTARVSVVERFPEKPVVSAALAKEVPCLAPQIRYYPPCTARPLPQSPIALRPKP